MRIALLAGALCLFFGSAAFAANTEKEEHSLRDVATKFTAAWNKHDAKAAAAFWADEGTLVNPMGRRANGRAEIEKLFTDEHTGNMRTTQATMNLETFRFMKDFAFVDAAMDISGMKTPDGKEMPLQHFHLAVLAVKRGKEWRWMDARPYAFVQPPAEVATNKN